MKEETLRKIIDSGCKFLSFSPESGSPEHLRLRMTKPFNHEYAAKLSKIIVKKNVPVQACFVHGYPGETDHDRFLTKQYIFLLAITSTLIITYFVIKLSQLDTKIHELVTRFRKLSIPLFKVIFFTLSTWLFEFFVFIIIFNTLLIDIEVLEMFIVFISSTLSTLIPSAPGYIGTFHFISSEILKGILEDEFI